MLRIAGQMAGPIMLNFFVDTQGWPDGVNLKKIKFFFQRPTPGPSASTQ